MCCIPNAIQNNIIEDDLDMLHNKIPSQGSGLASIEEYRYSCLIWLTVRFRRLREEVISQRPTCQYSVPPVCMVLAISDPQSRPCRDDESGAKMVNKCPLCIPQAWTHIQFDAWSWEIDQRVSSIPQISAVALYCWSLLIHSHLLSASRLSLVAHQVVNKQLSKQCRTKRENDFGASNDVTGSQAYRPT